MSKYLYYPGCSMDSSARAYHDSLMKISEPLNLGLEEIDDWNCCGATEYLSINQFPAYALISRNLALAQKQAVETKGANGKRTLVAPCSACYLNLIKADHNMSENHTFEFKVNKALGMGGLHYKSGSLKIRHLLDVLVNDIGLDTIKGKVTKPLKGLRVAPYVGCMVPRPDYEHRYSNPDYPDELDRLLKVLGAEVIDFPLKTHCCGGHMTQISPSTAFELIRRLIHAADEYKADLMVTLCPMCQMNLDAYQGETNAFFSTRYNMPIIFFTQLMGLAFGYNAKDLGFGKELVSARTALAKIGVEVPVVEEVEPAPKPKKPKREGLPMPVMPGDEERNE